MHSPIHLKQPDTTVVLAADHGMHVVALTFGDEQRGLFQVIRPHFANDRDHLFAVESLGWWCDDGLVREANLVADEDRCFRRCTVQRKQRAQRYVEPRRDSTPRVVRFRRVGTCAGRGEDLRLAQRHQQRRQCEHNGCKNLAEREGFEPSVRLTRTTP